MTPPQIDDHTLNACLARVIGVGIEWDAVINGHWWMNPKKANLTERWSPVTDPVQMELVEAWVAKTHNIEYVKYIDQVWGVGLWMPHGTAVCSKSDPDKKRAFALAIYQMEQENNGQ